jgi:hypothetical protein
MLLQTVNGKMLVFPAWPKEWNVDFKLHGPGGAIVRGVCRDGRVERLETVPPEREASLVTMPLQ